MSKLAVATLSIAITLISTAGFASTQSVVKGCISGGQCLALVKAEIASYKGSPAEKDRKIAALVAALVNASTGANQGNIAKGIAYAGSQSASAQQRKQIASIADAVNQCVGPLGSCLTETASNGNQGSGKSSNVTNSNGKSGSTSPSAPAPAPTPPAPTPPALPSPPSVGGPGNEKTPTNRN